MRIAICEDDKIQAETFDVHAFNYIVKPVTMQKWTRL